MIELAPQSKNGLPLRTPVTAGSGSCGLGSDWPPGLGPQQFGAVVTTPLTLAPRRGSEQPRLAEIPGGFVLDTGGHNPGLRRTLRENSEAWARLQVPLIVALSPGTPEDWTRLAERLEEIATVAALELHLPEGVRPSQAAGWVAGVRRAIAVPLLARLPVTGVGELAPACASAGADTLVVGTPPLARARTGSGWVEGPSAGPAAFPYTMRALRLIRRRTPPRRGRPP